MTRWTHTLPDVIELAPQGHAVYALSHLVDALGRDPADSGALGDVQYAAAHVRAWRKSLPEQGTRDDRISYHACDDRALLRLAIHFTLFADENRGPRDVPTNLRAAEAALRVLGKRLAARGES